MTKMYKILEKGEKYRLYSQLDFHQQHSVSDIDKYSFSRQVERGLRSIMVALIMCKTLMKIILLNKSKDVFRLATTFLLTYDLRYIFLLSNVSFYTVVFYVVKLRNMAHIIRDRLVLFPLLTDRWRYNHGTRAFIVAYKECDGKETVSS